MLTRETFTMDIFLSSFQYATFVILLCFQIDKVYSSQSILGIDPGRNLDLGNLVGAGNKLGIPTLQIGGTYDPAQEYKYPTEYPINIDTSLVKEIQVLPPFVTTTGPITKCTIRNTGRSVMLEQKGSVDTITGGPLGNNTYRFQKARFYWTNKTGEGARAATTINHKGYPLEFSVYYFNLKYGCFEEAITHRDGIVVVAFIFKVVPLIPNPLFNLFGQYLDKIITAGSEVHDVPLIFTYADVAPFDQQIHYLYPAAYFDEETNKTHYCTTQIMQTELEPAYLSEDQFLKFLKLRNYENETYINEAPLQCYRGQPIFRNIGNILVPVI